MDSRNDERSKLKKIMSETLDAILAVTDGDILQAMRYENNKDKISEKDAYDKIITKIENVKSKIEECFKSANHIITAKKEDGNVQNVDDHNESISLMVDVFNELKQENEGKESSYMCEILNLNYLIYYLTRDPNNIDKSVSTMYKFQRVIDISVARLLEMIKVACEEYKGYLKGIINKDTSKLIVSARDNGHGGLDMDYDYRPGCEPSRSIRKAIQKYNVVNRMLNNIAEETRIGTAPVRIIERLNNNYNGYKASFEQDRSNAAQRFLKAIAAAFADFFGLREQAQKIRHIEGRVFTSKLENIINGVRTTNPGGSVLNQSIFTQTSTTESVDDPKNNDQKKGTPTEEGTTIRLEKK